MAARRSRGGRIAHDLRRRQLARLFVIIGGLIVIVLTAALVGPYFIDWTSYRSDFEREASRILGRKVTVMGKATARLLPFPSVTFTNVRVASGTPGQPAVTVDKFSMDAELAPFLRGELLIFDMRVVRPHIVVAIDPDGTIDWTLRPSAPFNPRQITLEKVTVTDGSVTVAHGASGRELQFTGIDGAISAKSLAGPWRFQGRLVADGEPVSLDLSTGIAGADGRMRIRIKADPRDYPIELLTDGDTSITNGKAVYAGDFRLNVHADKAAIAAAKAAREPAPSDPYRLSGTFWLDHRRLAADQFRFETGPTDNPYVANGKAFLDFGEKPRFGISAKGEQVRFDEAVGNGTAGRLTLDERIAALKRVIGDLPKPTIPGRIDVRLPAVLAGDTTIRDVAFSAEPAEGGWTLKSFDAMLPGRTTLEASGFLRAGGDFGFKGSLLLAVKQPSGFANWIAHDVNDAIRRLPSAGFNADVDLTERHQAFRNLELILGDARFTGSLDSVEPADAAPSMTVKLDGGKLDVEDLTAFASLFIDQKGQNRLADRDLDLEVKAGPVTGDRLAAQSIDAAIRLKKGRLDIDRLSVSGLAGASLSATGSLKDFPADPIGDLDATVTSEDLAPLLSMLASRFPGNAAIGALASRAASFQGLFSNARINLVASAAKNKDGTTGIGASANGMAGDSTFTLSLSGNGLRNEPEKAKFSLTASLANDNAAPVYALLGLPALPLGLAGRLEADLSSKGSLSAGAATDLKLHGDGLDASFAGTVRLGRNEPTATGKAALATRDMGPWLMTAGISLPGMGLGLPVSLAGDIDYHDGTASLAHLKGSIAGSPVSGDLAARVTKSQPKITGKVSTGVLDLSLPLAMVLGQQSLQSKDSGWARTPFLSAAAPAFDADLDLSAGTVFIGGIAAKDARMKATLDRSGFHIDSFAGTYGGGTVSGLADLKNNDGTGLLSAQFRLAGVSLGDLLPGTGLAGKADLSTAVTASGKSLDAMVGALSGSGTLSFHDLAIPRLNADALKPILAAADSYGHEVDAKKASSLALPFVKGGTFKAGDGSVAFTVAEGTVRVPTLQLPSPKMTVNTDLNADLVHRTVAANGSISYAAGDDALVGSEPSLGFTVAGPPSALAVTYNTGPLAQFLTQRALEREQAKVEAMQAALLEKQRLHREVDYYSERDRIRRQQEEEKRKAEEEAARKAVEETQHEAEQADERLRLEESRKSVEAPPLKTAPPKAVEKAPPPSNPAAPRHETDSHQDGLKGLPGVTDFLQQHRFDFNNIRR